MEEKTKNNEINLIELEEKKMESFVRQTRKYFVKPEDIMKVKMTIIKHLSLDIFGRKKIKNIINHQSYLEMIR